MSEYQITYNPKSGRYDLFVDGTLKESDETFMEAAISIEELREQEEEEDI